MSCENCKIRQINCHSTCTTYQKYRAEIDKQNKVKRIDDLLNEFAITQLRRVKNGIYSR